MTAFLQLVSAIALLLWGLRLVRTGVMRSYGSKLKKLARGSNGRLFPAFLGGLSVAVCLQSSAATAMLVASFSGQGLLSSAAAFTSILGADIGTAIAVFLASQKIGWLSPLLISIGIFSFLSTENSTKRSLSRAVLGIGLILLALSMIGQIAGGVTQIEGFNTVLKVILAQPLLMLLLGVALTYFAHSSLAIILLTTGLIQTGVLDVENGLRVVLGANIGSGLLPLVAFWNGKKTEKIPVTANFIVRTLVVLFTFPFLSELLVLVEPYASTALMPVAFHLLLNLVVAVLGFLSLSLNMKLVEGLLPDDIIDETLVQPKHLDSEALSTPALALACAKREALHMADHAEKMVQQTLEIFDTGSENVRQKMVEHEDAVDRLFQAIKIYIAQIMREQLSEEESQQAIDLLSFTAQMEHIGDTVDGSLMELAAKKSRLGVEFSKEGSAEIEQFHEGVCSNFDLAINTFVSQDADLARQLHAEKSRLRKLEARSIRTHLGRIGTGLLTSLESSSIHLDVIRDLKRINSHLTAIAYPVLKTSGEVPKTKWKRRS
ncbi:MAG: Na/Pi cotransporter family protein [Rhizobiaceae bacterium]